MASATRWRAVLVPRASRSIIERLCTFILTYGGSGPPFASFYLLICSNALHVRDDPRYLLRYMSGMCPRPLTTLIIIQNPSFAYTVRLLRISYRTIVAALVSCTTHKEFKETQNALTSSSDAWIRAGVFQGIAFGTDEPVHCSTLPRLILASPTARVGYGLGPWH